MIRDIGILGAYTRRTETEMIDEMETAMQRLGLQYGREEACLSVPGPEGGYPYLLKACPLQGSYELTATLSYNKDSCPKTAAWLAELRTKERGKGNSEILVSYRLDGPVLRCTASARSGRNKEQVLLDLFGRLDRAVSEDRADFEALSNGVIPDTVIRDAKENIYPIVMELEQRLRENGG